jgi:hypothetical protein
MSLDERAFFTDKNETRPAKYTCTRCHRTNEYSVRWVRRVKKDRLPPGADERDRAKFAKLRDHLIRIDDEVVCKTCGRKFEIPSLHSLLFVDQFEGLPRDVEDEEATEGNVPGAGAGAGAGAATTRPERAASEPSADTRGTDRRGPRKVTSPPRGWRG